MISSHDRKNAVELIDVAHAAGAARGKACKELQLSLRTYQRWTAEAGQVKTDGRPDAAYREPANKLSVDERGKILKTCNQTEYQSLPPSQIVPGLADEGLYIASESSFYRVLNEAGQCQNRGKSQAVRKVHKPKSYKATGPNQVWSWDITFLASDITGIFFRLYMIMDIYSRKIVGWEVHESESAEQAAVLLRKACLAEGCIGNELVLHSDNGSPMKGATMLATLQKLGVVPSFSRPSVSDDNPYSESLFKTLKYTPAYPSKPFANIDAARGWVHTFVKWYNEEHHHSAIRFVTPVERHSGAEQEILIKRNEVYIAAKALHPERWSGCTRNWNSVKEVWLNPDKVGSSEEIIEEDSV